MQQRSAHRAATHLHAVPDDPAATFFHTSRIACELAEERREYKQFISMRLPTLRRMWCSRKLFETLGMPKLSFYEFELLSVLVLKGRLLDGRLTWTAMRPGQKTVPVSIAYETGAQRPHISTAFHHLCRVGLVTPLQLGDREAVSLADRFHLMMFEAQWRSELRNTAPEMVTGMLSVKGWDWLLNAFDDAVKAFKLDYHSPEDRRRVLGGLQQRCETPP